jgi:DNA-directed RNA polymerase subunit M/transcription elongation factor TFIIS
MVHDHPRPERKTDRVTLTIQVQIFGSDVAGMAFTEDTHTIELSQHGDLIAIKRQLAPQDEILVRREKTGKEADAKVLGQVARGPEGFVSAIRFIDPDVNLWDINFVPLSESERAVGRTLLECAKCKQREVVYLEEFEVEVYEANQYIFRTCQRCRESTIWKQSLHEPKERGDAVLSPPPPPPETPPAPGPGARTRNERRHTRVNCSMKACIHFPQHEDEILEVTDVSRGGFCFVTRKNLHQGGKMQVAIPYAPGAGNIFVPAKIVRVRPMLGQGITEYGAAYIKM